MYHPLNSNWTKDDSFGTEEWNKKPMTDDVLKSPSREAFLQAAHALGFAAIDDKGVITLVATGTTADGGNYFINEVGTVYEPTGATVKDAMGNDSPVMAAIPGHWSRIRRNNGAPRPDVPEGFEVFPPVKYLEDGITPDPAYTQPPYGMIA